MYCKKCQNVISEKDYYCPYCGYNNKKDDNPKKDEIITIKDCFKNFIVKSFSASGVATLKEFWVIYSIHIIASIILGIIGLHYVNTILNIIFFIPLMALAIRRYHDTNKSGAFAILGGYFKIGYLFSFYTSNDTAKYILLVSSLLALVLELILLSFPTNPNSRWNPVNGYLD